MKKLMKLGFCRKLKLLEEISILNCKCELLGIFLYILVMIKLFGEFGIFSIFLIGFWFLKYLVVVFFVSIIVLGLFNVVVGFLFNKGIENSLKNWLFVYIVCGFL